MAGGGTFVSVIIRLIASCIALGALSAQAADITGSWTATITTATGPADYTFVFRQNGARLIGTIKSQDGVVAIADGYINHRTVTFIENVTVEGRRAVIEYAGELVSDGEIKFERRTALAASPTVRFVATRAATR
jgi:hypothetical protein